MVAHELKRVNRQYGSEAVLSQSDGHGEGKGIHSCHGSANKLLQLLGGFTLQVRNTDSWEGWAWGAKHAWGMEPVGEMAPAANLIPDIAENSDMVLFWGCDPETTPWGFNGQVASRICYWFSEIGIKCIYICPDLNYGAACTLTDDRIGEKYTTTTDGFGDFWFENMEENNYSLEIVRDDKSRTIDRINTEKDINLGEIPLS